MFKQLLLCGLMLTTTPVDSTVVPPNEGETVTPPEEEETVPTPVEEKFIINTSTLEGGVAVIEIRRDNAIVEKGFQAGDTVLVSFKNDMFYALDKESVKYKVGETVFTPTFVEETKQWSFVLDQEGTYIIQAKFIIDNKTFEQFMNIYESFKAQNWESLLTPQVILFLVFVVIYVFAFLTKYFGDRSFKKKVVGDTVKTMGEAFGLTQNSTPEEILTTLVNKIILPILEDFKQGQIKEREMITILTKAFLYAQENTPEAKEHLVSMVGKIETEDKEVEEITNRVLAKLNEQEQTKAKEQEQINQNFDELKQEIATEETVDNSSSRPLD